MCFVYAYVRLLYVLYVFVCAESRTTGCVVCMHMGDFWMCCMYAYVHNQRLLDVLCVCICATSGSVVCMRMCSIIYYWMGCVYAYVILLVVL